MRMSQALENIQNRIHILSNQLMMVSTTTVLVVGANRGLGLQFAVQYLKKGFNVYGTYRKESADEVKEVCFQFTRVLSKLIHVLCQLLESGAKTMLLDLGDENSVQDAAKAFGDQPLDLLINCAGKIPYTTLYCVQIFLMF